MDKKIVVTDKAPRAIGPYSQAVLLGDYVFCSGQVALDPQSGQLLGGDIAAQTRRALFNLQAVLEFAGSSLTQVVKTTVYLTSLENFSAMNAVYAEFFSTDPPARTTVQVAGLPLGALVEIEAVAFRKEQGSVVDRHHE